MDGNRPILPADEGADLGDADRLASDAFFESEGVGGVTEVDRSERATVSDVDGDNVKPDPERNPEP